MVHRLTFVNKLNSALEFYSYWIWCEWNVHWMWCIHQQKQLFLNINSNHIRLRLRFTSPSLSLFLFVVVDVRDVIVFVWFCFNINMTFCWHYSFCIVCLSSVHYSKLSICVTDCIVLYCFELYSFYVWCGCYMNNRLICSNDGILDQRHTILLLGCEF